MYDGVNGSGWIWVIIRTRTHKSAPEFGSIGEANPIMIVLLISSDPPLSLVPVIRTIPVARWI